MIMNDTTLVKSQLVFMQNRGQRQKRLDLNKFKWLMTPIRSLLKRIVSSFIQCAGCSNNIIFHVVQYSHVWNEWSLKLRYFNLDRAYTFMLATTVCHSLHSNERIHFLHSTTINIQQIVLEISNVYVPFYTVEFTAPKIFKMFLDTAMYYENNNKGIQTLPYTTIII